MQKELKTIINSMDVNLKKEDAYSKASVILGMGSDVLGNLVNIGYLVNEKENDIPKRKKSIRAIIFIIAVFIKKNVVSSKILKNLKVIDFLYDFSLLGYQSAEKVLHDAGFSISDILKERLLSLPVMDTRIHDKEISLAEALEEIKISKLFKGTKGIKSDCYLLGTEGKRSYGLYRIGKKLFAYRSHKLSSQGRQ
jgi:hypothetical protein